MKDKGIVISGYSILDVLNLVRKQKMNVDNAREILQRRLKIPFSYDEGHKKTCPVIWADSFVTLSTVIYGPEEMIISLKQDSFPDPNRIRQELSDRVEKDWEDESRYVAKNVEKYWFGQNHFSLSKEKFDQQYAKAKSDDSGNTKIFGLKDIELPSQGSLEYNLENPLTLFIFGGVDGAKRYHEICERNKKHPHLRFDKPLIEGFIGGSFITLTGVGDNGQDNPNIYSSTQGLHLIGWYQSLNDRAHFIVRE